MIRQVTIGEYDAIWEKGESLLLELGRAVYTDASKDRISKIKAAIKANCEELSQVTIS